MFMTCRRMNYAVINVLYLAPSTAAFIKSQLTVKHLFGYTAQEVIKNMWLPSSDSIQYVFAILFKTIGQAGHKSEKTKRDHKCIQHNVKLRQEHSNQLTFVYHSECRCTEM